MARLWFIALGLLWAATLPAAFPVWSEEDIVTQERATELAFGPKGEVVWVRTTVDLKENRELGHLFFTEDLGPGRQLTRGPVSDESPKISPDGKLVVFLSNRQLPEPNKKAEGSQLWALPLAGGEPYPLTQAPRGIKAFAFASTKTVILLAEEAPDLWQREKEKAKDKAMVVEDRDRQPRVRLFELNIASKKTRRLTANLEPIRDFAVSPDGNWVVFQVNVSPSFEADARQKPKTYLLHRPTGQRHQILADRPATPQAFRFSQDSRFLAFSESFSSDPQWEGAGVEKLYRYDLATHTYAEVPLHWARGLHSPDSWAPLPEGFLVLLANGTRNVLAYLQETPQGFVRHDLAEDGVFAVITSRDGRHVALLRSAPDVPPQWFRGRFANGQFQLLGPLTRINEQLAGKPYGKVEVIRWSGAWDQEVEGILYYPLNYQPNRHYPLIVMIHGGPASADQWQSKFIFLSRRSGNPSRPRSTRGAAGTPCSRRDASRASCPLSRPG